MNDRESFSLERLEYLAYRRSYEQATAELVRMLAHLERQRGRLGDIGATSSGHLPAEQADVHFATRIASAVTALFSDPAFQLSDSGFRRLIPLQRWLASVFGASAVGNSDHVIRLLNEEGYDRRGRIIVNDRDLLKYCLLYSLDSSIPLQPDVLWQKDKRLAASMFTALLSSRVVATDEAHAKKEELLGWLPSRLRELSLDDFPAESLHAVSMYCSYAQRADKHAIKRAINELVRSKLMSAGFGDVQGESEPRPGKPVLLCILEWFTSEHSMYRCYSAAIEALKAKYRLVGVSLRQATDEVSRRIFDEIHVMPSTQDPFDTARHISTLANTLRPDIIYYPSVGMFLETLFLTNLRLAPLQLMTLGHPATTHSPHIDYVLVEEDFIGDADCFSETLVALPSGCMPFRPYPHRQQIDPQIRSNLKQVRIAVTASSMKINPAFLDALRQIAQQAKVAVEFHFLSGAAVGLTKVYLQNVIRRVLPNWAVVYPQVPYDVYVQNINGCDMFVDPFPFGNTNGIVDTVRQGLPGVCLTGPEVHNHIDDGLFRRLGLPLWLIARSPKEYIAAAVRLAENSSEREMLSRQILKAIPDSALFHGNAALFADAVEWLHHTRPTGGAKVLKPPTHPPGVRSSRARK